MKVIIKNQFGGQSDPVNLEDELESIKVLLKYFGTLTIEHIK